MPKGISFTVAHEGRRSVLVTACVVMEPFDPTSPPPQVKQASFNAIWDTGATNSTITQEVVDALGLVASGIVPVHGVHGEELAEAYLVNIGLPNAVAYPVVRVTKGKLTPGHAVLIGMDIIGSGDFAVTNLDGNTVMTFRFPSCKRIDFVQEFNSEAYKERMQGLIKNRHGGRKKKRR